MAAHDCICKHLHLPVQSGSNSILAQMNRKYTVEDYMNLITYAKATLPEMTYSSDIIVGFPGETDEDFERTYALAQEVRYMQLFTFIYSKRSGTAAASMPDATPYKSKSDRIGRLLTLQETVVGEICAGMMHKNMRALVENKGREDGTLCGRFDNNMTVEFAGDTKLIGQFVNIMVTGAKGAVLKGELQQ
ncbi:MAG: radical SAM protein, partial [Ruthenibacterium sp.]